MKRKNKDGIVFSTNPEFKFEDEEEMEEVTLPPEKQNLHLRQESKGRNGKTVTIVTGFKGRQEDLQRLAKELKIQCSSGGSVKDGEIIIQGNVRDVIRQYLLHKNFKVR
jgi:translation initiation factor 1